MSTLAVLIALGSGGSYAVSKIGGPKIDGREIRKHSLTGAHFKRNSIGGPAIKERSLGPVRRARNAAHLGGVGLKRLVKRLRDRCPEGMVPVSDVCFETQPRPALAYSAAGTACKMTDNKLRPGRRLPTHNELSTAIGDYGMQLAPGGELTDDVKPSDTAGEPFSVLYITDDLADADGVGLTPNTHAGAKAFRCVADPVN
jgi:hypothetical protein